MVALDAIKILKGELKKTDSSPSDVHVDIIAFNRFLVLGLCHKLLRVLEPIHYAAIYLNPGVGHILDFNKVIPYRSE